MEKERLVELVRQAQNGDQAAAEELLRAAYPPVSYQCRKMLKNEADAEDVTQEVLMTAYTKLADLQEPAAFWGWLNRLTATRCINAQTRWHKELQFAEDEDGNSVLDSFEDLDDQVVPDRAIDNAETARMIGELVDALPEAQRTCVMLYYFDELSVREIAAMTGVSENTVKSRLNYARKGIKEGVEGYEKQGVKLYGLSPLPFLLFFLRKNASAGFSDAVRNRTVAEILASSAAQGAAAAGAAGAGVVGTATSAAGVAGVAGAAGTTGATVAGAAAGVAKGISVKIVAAMLAGVMVIGGGVVTIVADRSKEQPSLVIETDGIATLPENDGPLELEPLTPEEIVSPLPPEDVYLCGNIIPVSAKIYPIIDENMPLIIKNDTEGILNSDSIYVFTDYVDRFISLSDINKASQQEDNFTWLRTKSVEEIIQSGGAHERNSEVIATQIISLEVFDNGDIEAVYVVQNKSESDDRYDGAWTDVNSLMFQQQDGKWYENGMIHYYTAKTGDFQITLLDDDQVAIVPRVRLLDQPVQMETKQFPYIDESLPIRVRNTGLWCPRGADYKNLITDTHIQEAYSRVESLEEIDGPYKSWSESLVNNTVMDDEFWWLPNLSGRPYIERTETVLGVQILSITVGKKDGQMSLDIIYAERCIMNMSYDIGCGYPPKDIIRVSVIRNWQQGGWEYTPLFTGTYDDWKLNFDDSGAVFLSREIQNADGSASTQTVKDPWLCYYTQNASGDFLEVHNGDVVDTKIDVLNPIYHTDSKLYPLWNNELKIRVRNYGAVNRHITSDIDEFNQYMDLIGDLSTTGTIRENADYSFLRPEFYTSLCEMGLESNLEIISSQILSVINTTYSGTGERVVEVIALEYVRNKELNENGFRIFSSLFGFVDGRWQEAGTRSFVLADEDIMHFFFGGDTYLFIEWDQLQDGHPIRELVGIYDRDQNGLPKKPSSTF